MADTIENARKAFIETFRQYKNSIYLYSLKMLGDKDSAGDISQEVFFRLYTRQTENRAIGDVKSWLFIVARNLCLNYIRDHKRTSSLDAVTDNAGVATGTEEEQLRQLRRALLSLEPKYRETLILKEYQGFSYSEIAEITGTTIPAIRSLLYKARLQLKDAYKKNIIVR
jgi:RNA polymerase sigma-70 factor (ECF subfamily)